MKQFRKVNIFFVKILISKANIKEENNFLALLSDQKRFSKKKIH